MTPYVGLFLGLAVGATVAGPFGGALGAVIGLVIGMIWAMAVDPSSRIPADAVLVKEERHLLCMPKGQLATTTFVRDAGTRRWLDVERCSLCHPSDHIECGKRCLSLMRDTVRTAASGAGLSTEHG